MAAVAVNTANINPMNHEQTERQSYIAAEAITAGDPVYMLTTGKVGRAGANTSGKRNFLGVAMKTAGAGQVVGVLKRGLCSGFTVSGLNAGAAVYLSDTVGAYGDAAGTTSVVVGKVEALSDSSLTKVLYVMGNQTTVLS
jgi:hypothetical protein